MTSQQPRQTVSTALLTMRRRLEQAGIEDAGLEAEVLLRHALNTDRAHLFQRMDAPLSEDVMNNLYRLVQRRLSHEPVAYITGHREFYGLELHVNRDVLIPRPETETLVEAVIEFVRAWRRPDEGLEADFQPLIADVGTGSGAIAVSLAVNLPDARIRAIDLSAGALAVARANARLHEVEDRIEFLAGNLLQPLTELVDLIAANLPYVKADDWLALPPEIREHEPRAALDGGADGLDLIRPLLEEAPRHLLPGGAIFLEFGAGQQNALLELAGVHFRSTIVRPDLAGRPRVLVAQ